ncbi:MAG TPA: NADH-quinone oxidoreductase subunit NuoH [Planctomycetes bacterium]|nr:NADH-quinone oxidoreductase subunit NuoH [Planctomycetota bacterium]HIL52806.1 NADH-quinone oxidoreductase subunit NuoH [Planctomycetota bacterium]
MTVLLATLLKVLVIFGCLISAAGISTLAERKISAWIQLRRGPNRVGPFGLLQPLADGIKFMFKEEFVPPGKSRFLFILAPALAAVPAMMSVAVIPFTGRIAEIDGTPILGSVADLDMGAIFIMAVSGLGVYGIILGGWASNSKYPLLGGLRAAAQMISYELSMILIILAIVAMSGTLNLREIADAQNDHTLLGFLPAWNVFLQPLAFVLFVICTFAETNRHPFDFAECESELVGGFHTEYSSMKFALFFIGEYCAMIVMACLTTTLFLGGASVPFWAEAPWFIGLGSFVFKAAAFMFLFIWVRWSLPRFRYDQLMALGWKVFLPLAITNIFITGLVLAL